MPENYLPELLKNLQKSIDRIEKKTDDQSTDIGAIKLHTQSMSSDIELAQADIDQVKNDIKNLEKSKGKKLNINLNSPVLYLVALAAVISLIIVASRLGVDINLKGLL